MADKQINDLTLKSTPVGTDELVLQETGGGTTKKATAADLISNHTDVAANTAARHDESHTIASHSDTTATGAELNELTDGSETTLHSHAGSGAPEGTAVLSTGETGAVKYLREDGDGTCSWQVPAGSGDVSKVGTPVDSQVGVWTGDGTIEGDAALTFDTTSDNLSIGASGKLSFGAVDILTDSAGTTTLNNIDAIDATTETTLETAIDSLSNLTTVGTITSGTWNGTDIAVADGGTGASDAATARTNLGLAIGTDVLAEQTIGIADDNLLEVDDADAADNDYAKFTANGLEGRSYAEVRTDLGLVTNSGSWTPVLTCATPGDLSVAYSTQSGSYFTIGNLVIATVNIVTSSFTHTTASGIWRITGLPETAANTAFGMLQWGGIDLATNYTNAQIVVISGQSYFEMRQAGDDVAIKAVSTGQGSLPTGNTVEIKSTFVYEKS